MRKWFKDLWKAHLDSIDPEILMSGSTPGAILFVVLTLSAIFLGLAYAPGIAPIAEFQNVWVAVLLVAIAGSLTFTAWHHRCRGPIGSAATLLDNAFYSTAMAFAAMNTKDNVGIALAAIHAVVLGLFPGQVYAFSLVFAACMLLPILVLLAIFQPSLPVTIITIMSTLAMLLFSSITRTRREAARHQRKLEEALGAADRIADESVQAALATTLLTLGHFLHELRNFQTAISTNLDYIRLQAQLSSDTFGALEEAQTVQREQEQLVRDTIADLRGRSLPVQSTFLLSTSLQSACTEARGVEVLIEQQHLDIELTGNPEHLRVVLLNLIRNAEQAGANRVRLTVQTEASGQSVQLIVQDDGPGVPEEHREHLFDSFAVSTKPGGSGLGLYLVRRYVELLGGKVRVHESPLGGAAFSMRLPGRVLHLE